MPARPQPQVALGAAIRELRLRKQLSQEELGNRADIHPTWLSHIEAGRNPAWSTVKRIADALEVSVAELAALEAELEASSQHP